MNCVTCEQELLVHATTCANCGAPVAGQSNADREPAVSTLPGGAASAPLGGSTTRQTTSGPSVTPGGGGAPGGRAATTLKFDAGKLSQADKITGVASFILLISLFLPWFSLHVAFGTYSGSGESVHGYLWIVFLLCLGLVAYLGARAFLPQLPFKLPLPHERLVLAVTAVNLVLVVLAFVFKPGGLGLSGVGWSFGAFVALIAAVAACAPLAVPAIQARRKTT